MSYLGDYAASKVIYGKFTTQRPSTGAPFTLAGTPALSVYKDNSTTQSTTGVTLTVDFDSVTGLNHFAVDTSADGTFYSAGSNFDIVITTGTVDSVSAVGFVVGSFSIAKVAALRPATADRTVVVDASGLADSNTVKIGPTGSGTAQTARDIGASVLLSSGTGTGQVSLSSGLVDITQTAADKAWSTAARTLTAGTNIQLPSNGLANVTAWTVAITGNITGNLSGSVGSVTGNVGGNVTGSVGSVVGAVGSVTGAVGSVTGAVGSVTGNVGGNVTGSVGSLATQAKADVNAEVLDVLTVDTFAEPGQGAPAATASLAVKLAYVYKAFRNKVTQTATTFSLFADDTTTVDQKATTSDDGTTFTRTEIASGP